MSNAAVQPSTSIPDDVAFLADGGEMGRLLRAHDWTASPLSLPAGWPDALKMAVSICINSRFPMVLWWGPEFVMLYNDAWRPVLGESKHPGGLGRPGIESWPEIWDVIGEQLTGVLKRGEASWSEDLLLVLDRFGYNEEAYFTYSYSPIKDVKGVIAGVFSAVNETTSRVLGERRLSILRELAARTADAKTVESACGLFAEVLGENNPDLPFALLYLGAGDVAQLMASAGVEDADPRSPAQILLNGNDPWHIAKVMRTGQAVLATDLAAHFGELTGGAWPEPTTAALILPIAKAGENTETTGVLVAGINSRCALDDAYRSFLDLVAAQMATAVANARAYEHASQRAEALAEIDRAKTLFFSNVSHEFRTPLTLILGPLEDALGDDITPLNGEQRERLIVARRNSLRLLKLVNALLDFSRIEAGRVQAVFEPTDLATLTADIASNFRAAVERAGLNFAIDCSALPEVAYVDRDMWEKIVLNLISNAFKFTFEGGVAVKMGPSFDGRAIELVVSDTGVGLPADEIPRLFERFHRVEGQKSRSIEGSGIGLALVRELVKQHGGSIAVESVVAQGTSFTVTIPIRPEHIPPPAIAPTSQAASGTPRVDAFVEEALLWLPEASEEMRHAEADKRFVLADLKPGDTVADATILVADDNGDMRAYVSKLLGSRWNVETVVDGHEALEAIRNGKPDLLVTDVMMPGLDGFELLRRIRADPRLRDLPVIMLSARAGEEARVQGLDAGADDYLIKPFSARELMARVSSTLNLSRVRKQAEVRQQLLVDELNHRVKNTLASVQSIATQSLKGSMDAGRRKDFEERLIALSLTHNLLSRESWESASLQELLLQELAPYRSDGRERFAVHGPELLLGPKAALALGMAFHELTTNAVKYGALSNEQGQVHVNWEIAKAPESSALRLRWAETGGPPVKPRERKGFGSTVIERGLLLELEGEVRLDFNPGGLICTLAIPLPGEEIVNAR